MKLFLVVSIWGSINIALAQCPYNLAIDILEWEGKTVTLKWHCMPKPLSGQFDIFRTCLSKNKEEIWISSIATTKSFQFSDTDKDLKNNLIYKYRLQLSSNEKCTVSQVSKGRVIEKGDFTDVIIRNLSSFTLRDIVKIKPKKMIIYANTYIPVEVEIKDFKFPFSTDMKYALICGDKVIETVYHFDDDDSRLVSVFILENSSIFQEFTIALMQGNSILGVSPPMLIKE